jgi:hypothetical protein
MIQNTYGARPRLLPAERHNSYGPPKEKLARVPHQAHEMNWVNVIRGTDEISCPFSYAAHLVEIMLLGVVSLRAGAKIHYDGANMKVTDTIYNGTGQNRRKSTSTHCSLANTARLHAGIAAERAGSGASRAKLTLATAFGVGAKPATGRPAANAG